MKITSFTHKNTPHVATCYIINYLSYYYLINRSLALSNCSVNKLTFTLCVDTEIFLTQLDVLICVGFGLWPDSYFYKLGEREKVILPKKSTQKSSDIQKVH